MAHTAVHQQAAAVRTKRRTEKALQVMHRLLVYEELFVGGAFAVVANTQWSHDHVYHAAQI